MKLVMDMASILQTGLRKGKDEEFGREIINADGRKELVNSAQYGYENAVSWMCELIHKNKAVPQDVIMVFEGRDSKKRRMNIMPDYKVGRGKSCPEYYVEYNKLKDMVKEAFMNVGAIAVTQDLAEGDDTAKFLAVKVSAYEPVIVCTNDVDLSVLNSDVGHGVKVQLGTDDSGLNKLGDFSFPLITLYKTLVGKSKENAGCKGFGAEKFKLLMAKYGEDGCYEILDILQRKDLETLSGFVKANSCKVLGLIENDWFATLRSYQVSLIHDEWVDTQYYPLKIEARVVGRQVEDDRLKEWSQRTVLVNADNFDVNYERLKVHLAKQTRLPSLDIETTTSEESDEWLEAIGEDDGVDVMGSTLAGFSITFGQNSNYTLYVSVNHLDSNNIKMSQARKMMELLHPKGCSIHNTSFELSVLYLAEDEDGTPWREHWKDAGAQGFLPNVRDTLFEASYVDENDTLGLKKRALRHLEYKQVEFNDMRTFELQEGETKPYPGGKTTILPMKEPVFENGEPVMNANGKQRMATVYRPIPKLDAEGNPRFKRDGTPIMGREKVTYSQVVYKMHELPSKVVFSYGCDDTIVTSCLHNVFKLHMYIDEHYHVYKQVELDAAYIHAKGFVDGFAISISRLKELQKEDMETRAKAMEMINPYLIANGWSGTTQPTYTPDIKPAEVKEAYAIVMNLDDEDDEDGAEVSDEDANPIMTTKVRKIERLAQMIRDLDTDADLLFADALLDLLKGNAEGFNKYVGTYFDGTPRFKSTSPKQMKKLLYEVMELPVQVRNKVTPEMRRAGIRQGTPKTDKLAVGYGKLYAKENGKDEILSVLEGLELVQMVNTRESLFYSKYPGFVHWRTGKVHSSHRQCSTNTRRASASRPNIQQMPKHAKIDGHDAEFRSVVRPHKVNAVIVSMDFASQELRIIAEYSQDENMLACFVGDNLRDMHALTGVGILRNKFGIDVDYETFERIRADKHEELNGQVKKARAFGKSTNFAAAYGAMAEKLGQTLFVSEEDAQLFIDAREAAFPKELTWKASVVDEAKEKGFVRTMSGAKRHLADLLNSKDRSVSSKAERQAVNFKVQGSAAEMTKLAEGRMWRRGLFDGRFDAQPIGPVHDEFVCSVAIEDLHAFIPEMHACMVEKYADMQIPIASSISFGPNFYDQIEIGNFPTKEAIDYGLEKLREMEAQPA